VILVDINRDFGLTCCPHFQDDIGSSRFPENSVRIYTDKHSITTWKAVAF